MNYAPMRARGRATCGRTASRHARKPAPGDVVESNVRRSHVEDEPAARLPRDNLVRADAHTRCAPTFAKKNTPSASRVETFAPSLPPETSSGHPCAAPAFTSKYAVP